MSSQDWRTPFLKLRDQLRPLFDADLRVYHGVLMAPFHESGEVTSTVNELEQADVGRLLLREIDTPTDGCKHHAHYFFGNNACFQQLGRCLNGIEDWIREIPDDLVPEFHIPRQDNAVNKNLVRWANLVYYVAWELDAPYLQGMVEFRAFAHEGTFLPWDEWPQPSGCDPRPWLIHQGNPSGRIDEWLTTFSNEDLWMPDIIDAYLLGESMVGEFIRDSLTAIDGLIYILSQVREDKQQPAEGFTKPLRKRLPKSLQIQADVTILKAFLALHHNPEHSDEEAFKPLTSNQIATKMNWFSATGAPQQTRVSRRMAVIFGADAMKKYRSLLQGDALQGFVKSGKDGLRDIEAIDFKPHPGDASEQEEA
jgi:hypothetical protein